SSTSARSLGRPASRSRRSCARWQPSRATRTTSGSVRLARCSSGRRQDRPRMFFGFRFVRRLIFLALALWLVVELLAIPATNAIVAHEVSSRSHNIGSVSASAGPFPLFARAVVSGTVGKLRLILTRVGG